ncbi:CBS domain-containing protein [Nonomuraea sp. NPDC003560]|uniref:CBS domain-containing protein n=1 Tax=Nonomuraea sp. NPDC003560 TaxID=3364341 RepID=UPI003694FC08
MTRDVVTVTETTDVTVAIDLMVGKRVKSPPVVNGSRIAGMVSRRDLMAMLARTDEDLRQEVEAALREQYPNGPSLDVAVHDGVPSAARHRAVGGGLIAPTGAGPWPLLARPRRRNAGRSRRWGAAR